MIAIYNQCKSIAYLVWKELDKMYMMKCYTLSQIYPIWIGIPSWISNLLIGWNSKLNMDSNWNSKLNSWSVGRVYISLYNYGLIDYPEIQNDRGQVTVNRWSKRDENSKIGWLVHPQNMSNYITYISRIWEIETISASSISSAFTAILTFLYLRHSSISSALWRCWRCQNCLIFTYIG